MLLNTSVEVLNWTKAFDNFGTCGNFLERFPDYLKERGLSEEILGNAVAGKRQNLLISTKTTFRLGEGPNDVGSSRYHIVRACEASLRRLKTDYIDIYHMHGFDGLTPVEETLETLDTLVRSGRCATSPAPISLAGI